MRSKTAKVAGEKNQRVPPIREERGSCFPGQFRGRTKRRFYGERGGKDKREAVRARSGSSCGSRLHTRGNNCLCDTRGKAPNDRIGRPHPGE